MVRAARGPLAGFLLAAAGLALIPWLASPFQILFSTEILIFSLYALAFNLLFGITGLLSFGHSAYYGVGGYVAAFALVHGYTSLPGALALGMAAAALAGLLIGYFCVRLDEIYFAMLTLAFSQMLFAIAWQWTEVTGGSDGILGVPRPPLRFPGGTVALESAGAFYALVAVVVLGAALLLWAVVASPFGEALRAIRENPERAEFIGIPVRRYRLAAFVLSAAFAGLAGALVAPFGRTASPELLFWTKSAEPVLMSLLGGIRVFLGPVVGVVVYLWLRDLISSRLVDYWMLVMGGIVIALVLFFRGGIVGAALTWWRARPRETANDDTPRDERIDQVVRPHGGR
ncbi:MAG: branched-chain amino acid ABC transporter permease [candidate division NC10 bacterium]|nr:branched-chain amino acid ABC transporter permease [candidate division NC10 bacterium]